jgi:hypothetical protein
VHFFEGEGPWLKKVEQNKPWVALPLQVSREVDSFVSMAVVSEIGDGTNTLFWRDGWVAGKSIRIWLPGCSPMFLSIESINVQVRLWK